MPAILAAVLLGAAGAFWLVNAGPAGPAVAKRLASLLSRHSGLDVQVSRVRFLPDRVTLDGVQVTLPAGLRLDLEHVSLVPDFGAFVEGRPGWKHITARGFLVAVPREPHRRSAAGTQQDRSRLAALRNAARRMEKFADALAPRGALDVDFEQGLVRFGNPGQERDLPVASIRIQGPRTGDASWRATVVLAPPGSIGESRIDIDFDPAITDVRATIEATGLPLEALSGILMGAALDEGASRDNALSGHVAKLPTLDCALSIHVRPDTRQVDMSGRASLNGLVIEHSGLASMPFGPIDLVQQVELTISWDPLTLHVNRWSGWINGAAYTLDADFRHDPDGSPFSARLILDNLPYQDILDAIPREAVPNLAGVRLGGSLDLVLTVKGDLEALSDVSISWSGDWSRLWLAEPSDTLKGPAPLAGHVFIPESTTGVVQRMTLGRGSPSWVSLEDLPPYLIDALLVSEDISFYRHHGFDTEGLSEALHENLKAGRAVRGGSTITQQLAKNLFLSRERTLARKLQEAVLAWQLEQRLGKDDILEYYLNIIEWGPGIYGVERAAGQYFNKRASELSLREAAYLCTIIPAPVRSYAYYRRGRLTQTWKRNVDDLLTKMHTLGYIDDQGLQRGLEQTIRFWHPPILEDGPVAAPAPGTPRAPDDWNREALWSETGPKGPGFE